MKDIREIKANFDNAVKNDDLSNEIKKKGNTLLNELSCKKIDELTAISSFISYIDGIEIAFKNMNKHIYVPFLEISKTEFEKIVL